MAIHWKTISSPEMADAAIQASHEHPIVIFKHSTTCPISGIAKMRLEGDWDLENLPAYYVDVKSDRQSSLHIAEALEVHHESPQMIVVSNGEAVYDTSHLDINIQEVHDGLKEIAHQ